jgi:replicative DNA helicase
VSIGREPPQAIEAEEYLVSCCLIDGNDTIRRCIEGKVIPAAFTVPANRVIFGRLLDLYHRNVPIDLASLAVELADSKQLELVGGFPYLTQISARIPTTADASLFIEKIVETYRRREFSKLASLAVESCYRGDAPIEELSSGLKAQLDAHGQVCAGLRVDSRFGR